MKAAVTIAWRDLPKYLDTFYPKVNCQLKNVEQAPSEITIIVDNYLEEYFEIDFLPLIKMRHEHPTFQCHFVGKIPADELGLDPEDTSRDQRWLKADSEVIFKLMDHTYYRWLHDVSAGKVDKILIDTIGGVDFPAVTFHVYADEVLGRPKGAYGFRVDQEDLDQYLGAMHLIGFSAIDVGGDTYELDLTLIPKKGCPSVQDNSFAKKFRSVLPTSISNTALVGLSWHSPDDREHPAEA
jgi:hypothetical protein